MSSSTPQYFSRLGQCDFLDINEDELDTSSLQCTAINSLTRDLLFSGHGRGNFRPAEASIDATTLLSNLGHLAPSVAKDFVLKDYAEASVPLRLLKNFDDHGENHAYIALSYCRKKTTFDTPRRVITHVGALPFGWQKETEQFPLPASRAVFQAVLGERRVGEGLWFDQVCINHEDEDEQAAALGAIDMIYKNARAVVVALDDVIISSEEEQFLRIYAEHYSYSELPHDQQPHVDLSPPIMQQYPALLSFLKSVLDSAWFDRAWCAHEMRMSQSHVFLVPCYTQHEDEIQTIIRVTGAFFLHLLVLALEIIATMPTDRTKLRLLHDVFLQKVSLESGVTRPDTPQSFITHDASLVSTTTEIFNLQAGGNPRLPEYQRRLDANRDKMGIALNASGLPLALAPTNTFSRPNIEDECLRSLLLVALAARDPAALCTTGTPLRLHDGSISWLCRPITLDVILIQQNTPRFGPRPTPITQRSDGRAEYAQLDLIFLDLPHRTHPNPQFPAQVARARTLIDLCIQYQLYGSSLWNLWQTPNQARALTMRNIFIQTLACVFECGPQWLLEVSSRHQSALQSYTIEMLLNPQLIIQNYILLPDGRAALSSLLTFLSTLIKSGIPWACGASERNYGPLIVTAPASTQVSSYGIPYTNAGKAVIFAPFVHSKTLLIAVPEVIKDLCYDRLARGWVLTSMHPYTGSPRQMVSWTLQSKGVVFGDVAFREGLEKVREGVVRCHRVYGPSTT